MIIFKSIFNQLFTTINLFLEVKSRKEATTQAIIKANEIYNELGVDPKTLD